jgi:glutaconyl-CoA/methylmalonyl-CoA decarboxylase subunit gamma
MEELKVNIDGKDYAVKIEEGVNHIKVHLDGKVYTVETSLKNQQKEYEIEESSGGGSSKDGQIKATLPGIIFSVDVKEGDTVKKGQKLISFIAMKMENQILSPKEGVVKSIKVKKNDKVNKGDILMSIE